MKNRFDILYWVIVSVSLILLFYLRGTVLVQTIYFTISLLPIAIISSFFFNNYLVERFLLKERYALFSIYTIYTIIISLYLETLFIFLSLIIFSYFQIEGRNILTIDIVLLAFLIYTSVLIRAFIFIVKSMNIQTSRINELELHKKESRMKVLTIKANRMQQQIQLAELIYIESLGDQLKYKMLDREIINRDKISHVENQLPSHFIRIHRSFIVNKFFIQGYKTDELVVQNVKLPISRTYKQKVKEQLA